MANKSYTGLRLTPAGESALGAYLAELEVIVASLKLGMKATGHKKTGGYNGGSGTLQGEPGLSERR